MEPTKSQGLPKNSQRWPRQQQGPSIQYQEDLQDHMDYQGKRRPTPLTDGPDDDEHSDSEDTDSIGNRKDTVVDHGQAGGKAASRYFGFTMEEIGTALLMGGVEFSIHAFMSLIGTFFAVRATAKGVSATEIGLIFGIVPLVSLIFSPLFGTYITHIGLKFLLVSGVMTVGSCSILFGFVDWIQDRAAFVALCLCVRGVEGAGTAAGHTAVYSLLTHTFPDRLATMSAYIEALASGGFIVGPPLGGALYQAGGFQLPFFSCGPCLLLLGLTVWVLMPSPKAKSVKHQSCWRLLRRPSVVLLLLNAVAGVASIAFLLSLSGNFVTTQFLFSPVQVSLVYMCIGGGFFLGTLIWSAIIKQWPKAGAVTYSGAYIMTGITLMFIGPAPFMQLHSDIGLFCACAFLVNLGLSSELIAYYIMGTEAKEFDGASLDSSGWVGGVLSASFSLGSFIGPVVTGAMYDKLGFPWTSTVIGIVLLVLASAQLLNHFLSQSQLCTKPQEEEKVPFAQLAEEDNAKYTE